MAEANDPARAARDEFLRRYAADVEAGAPRELAAYQALFPAFADAIAQEYRCLEDEGERAPEPDAGGDPATRFGDYRIVAELGRGGQAIVYLAEEERLGRQVALKVLRAGAFGTRDDVRRFQREAEVTARLDHPGICSVFVAGEHDGVPYLAMRLVRGETLAQRIARGREAPGAGTASTTATRAALDESLAILERCARILHFAHEHGLVHRDVKPGNVMLTPDGEPVLLDFGLAHAGALDHSLTLAGSQLGTPYYMAPEQIRGELARVDRRTDVYALGVVAYETLSLQRPFEAPSREALYRSVLSGAPRPLRDVAPGVPRDLEVVVATALAAEPARRYQSALDLAEDLRRVRTREPIRARPAGPLLRLWSWARRRPAVAALLAALALVTVAGIVILTNRNLLLAERFAEVTRLADLRRVQTLRSALARLPASRAEHAPALQAWLQEADALLARLPAHRATLERLRREPGDDAVAAQWQGEAVADLIGQLERFAAHQRPLGAARREHAATVERRSLVDADAAWRSAIAAIAGSKRYGGLRLLPQRGLVPLGADPDSGLWEFAHLASGTPATRGGDGRLRPAAADGIVLVLLPGGTFTMGARLQDAGHAAGAPNVDPWSGGNESPPHAVTLEPFFLAKLETTRAQWRRLTGEAPSQADAGQAPDEPTDLLPVNTVSHVRCRETFEVLGLLLPTEAQWEYGARAGTTSAWWFGNDREQAVRAGNVMDRSYLESTRQSVPDDVARRLDDGYAGVAPVGRFAPNGFGLLDTVGNVLELTDGEPIGYVHPVRAGDGLRVPPPDLPGPGEHCVIRGGDWASLPQDCRSATRNGTTVESAAIELGVRAARRVER